MSLSVRLVLLALPAVAAWPPAPAAAQPPGSTAEKPRATFPEDYMMLLEACRGEPPGSLLAREALAGWAGARLAQALAGISSARAQASADPGAVARAGDGLLAFAAAVHTDLAFAALDARQGAPATAHFEMARGLVGLLAEPTSPPDLKPRWFLAVGCRHRRDFELDQARAWLRAGLAARPDDPRLLLALGSADELMATFRNSVCASVAECATSAAREQYLGVEWERQRLAAAAEASYRRALAADPALGEARLRLGRLLALHTSRLRGRDELRAAQAQVATDRLRSLAHLFLGSVLEQLEQPAEALAEQRAALALCAGSQAARLAVARSLGRAGDRAGARETILPLLTSPGPEASDPAEPDPWWLYALGPQVCDEREWRQLSRELGGP